MKLSRPLIPPPDSYPFFYGWVILAVATIGTIMSIPGQTMGVSVFTDHLIRVTGLDRNDLSLTYMIGTIASALLLPLAGIFYDRHGARKMIVVASACMALTLWYLASTREIIAGAAEIFSVPPTQPAQGQIAFVVLASGFLLVRFWGQGVLTMISRAMLGKWFDKRRGLVSGISGIFVSASFASAPRLLHWMIVDIGWSGAWKCLALANGGLLVIGWLFYRDNPEECGLQMDGSQEHDKDPATGKDGHDEISATLGEALSSRAFWIPNLSLALWGFALTGLTFHIVSIGSKAELPENETLQLFLYMAPISIFANILGGLAIGRVRIRLLFFSLMLALVIASVAMTHLESGIGRLLTIVCIGASGGLFSILLVVIWPRFFGRKHLGKISSINMMTMTSASALGPWLFAQSEKNTGSYDTAFIGCAAAAALLLLASLKLKNPAGGACADTKPGCS
jgi:MFS family permease